MAKGPNSSLMLGTWMYTCYTNTKEIGGLKEMAIEHQKWEYNTSTKQLRLSNAGGMYGAENAVHGREDLQGIPPQLFFVHQGQSDIKEIHWHRQLPGVVGSTAGDSFHMLKPANTGDGPASAE